MKDTTPQAVQASHELLLWLIPQLDKFPRVRRFTLGERLEETLLEVLELAVEAAFSRTKQNPLQQANRRLEVTEGFASNFIGTRSRGTKVRDRGTGML